MRPGPLDSDYFFFFFSRLFSHKSVRLSTGYFKETLIIFMVSFLLLFSGKNPVLPPAFLHF